MTPKQAEYLDLLFKARLLNMPLVDRLRALAKINPHSEQILKFIDGHKIQEVNQVNGSSRVRNVLHPNFGIASIYLVVDKSIEPPTNKELNDYRLRCKSHYDVIIMHNVGKQVERLVKISDSEEVWQLDENPEFHPNEQYRVLEKPSIDPSAVTSKWNFLAVDKDGWAHVYTEEPILGDDGWVFENLHCDTDCVRVDHILSSYYAGQCDWKNSLIRIFHPN